MRRLRPSRTPLSVLRIELSQARDEVEVEALLRRLFALEGDAAKSDLDDDRDTEETDA